MNRIVNVLFGCTTLLLSRLACAQEVTQMPEDAQQSIGLDAGLEAAFFARGTYQHRLPIGNDTRVYARFTWPFAGPDLHDFAFDAGISTTLVGSGNWKIGILAGPILRSTANDMFSATAIGIRAALLPGYQSRRWGIALELGSETNLTTHLTHTQLYRDTGYAGVRDGWYAMPGGTLQLGLRGGFRLGNLELLASAGLQATEHLEAGLPPYYATVGSTYAF
jgi:hypothetical protein